MPLIRENKQCVVRQVRVLTRLCRNDDGIMGRDVREVHAYLGDGLLAAALDPLMMKSDPSDCPFDANVQSEHWLHSLHIL